MDRIFGGCGFQPRVRGREKVRSKGRKKQEVRMRRGAPCFSTQEKFPAETQETQRVFGQDLQDGQDWALKAGWPGIKGFQGVSAGLSWGRKPQIQIRPCNRAK